MKRWRVKNPQTRKRESPAEGLRRGGLRNPNLEPRATDNGPRTPQNLIGRTKPFRRKALEPKRLASVLPRMRQRADNSCGLRSATGGSPLRFEISDCGMRIRERRGSEARRPTPEARRQKPMRQLMNRRRTTVWEAYRRRIEHSVGLAGWRKVVSFLC